MLSMGKLKIILFFFFRFAVAPNCSQNSRQKTMQRSRTKLFGRQREKVYISFAAFVSSEKDSVELKM